MYPKRLEELDLDAEIEVSEPVDVPPEDMIVRQSRKLSIAFSEGERFLQEENELFGGSIPPWMATE